jgi:hypothetical protein
MAIKGKPKQAASASRNYKMTAIDEKNVKSIEKQFKK